MFRLKRNIRITGTREDGTAFDPVAESAALDEEERMVRRYRRPRLYDIEHDIRVFPRPNTGAFRAPQRYGATPSTQVPLHLEDFEPNVHDDRFDAVIRRLWGPQVMAQGLKLAGWALTPLVLLASMACHKFKDTVARR